MREDVRGARKIIEPGESVEDLSVLLGVDDRPELEEEFQQDLEAVKDAERRAEYETEGIRLD